MSLGVENHSSRTRFRKDELHSVFCLHHVPTFE